jgi:hypothetical protein
MRQANHDRITTRHTAMLPAPTAPSATSCPPDGPTSPSASRRGILAGVAASLAAGAALNAAALVKARSATPDDADLIALGRQLDKLIDRHEILGARYDEQWGAGYGARYQALRKELADANRNDLAGMEVAGDKFMSEVEELQREFGIDDLLEGMDAQTDAMCPIQNAILGSTAVTLAGLAVKARSAAFACSHFWNENDTDADWDIQHARSLIDAVLALPVAAS